MADENNNLNNQNTENQGTYNQNVQSGSYYEPQPTDNVNQYNQPQAQQQYYQAPQGNGQFNYNYNMPPMPAPEEKANVGLAILSFFIPIVGLVLYLTQKKDKPKTAKACGKCALASTIIYIIFCIIIFAASAALTKKALEDPNAAEYLQEYSEILDNLSDEIASDGNTIPDDQSITGNLGGERQGYVSISDKWKSVDNSSYGNEDMLSFTNNSEIITMSYYDATGYTKEDVRASVTSSITSASETVGTNVSEKKNQQFSYDDFYGESAYMTYTDGYQLFMLFFQSDETSDMIYIAIESPDMDTEEFKNMVNQTVNSHTFVTHQLDIAF